MQSVSITTNVGSSNPAQVRFDLWRLVPLSTIKLTVHCDNIDINCIIDKRLETKYTSFGSVLGCQDRRGKYVVLSMLFLDITLNQKKNNATILPYSNNIQKLGSSFRVSAQSIEVS
jgi:hypothetical protein